MDSSLTNTENEILRDLKSGIAIKVRKHLESIKDGSVRSSGDVAHFICEQNNVKLGDEAFKHFAQAVSTACSQLYKKKSVYAEKPEPGTVKYARLVYGNPETMRIRRRIEIGAEEENRLYDVKELFSGKFRNEAKEGLSQEDFDMLSDSINQMSFMQIQEIILRVGEHYYEELTNMSKELDKFQNVFGDLGDLFINKVIPETARRLAKVEE